MAKEDLLTLDGQIDEILPDGRFGVLLENDHRIIAYTAGKMRKFRIRSIVGDRVRVEMTPYDLTKVVSSTAKRSAAARLRSASDARARATLYVKAGAQQFAAFSSPQVTPPARALGNARV
jgi:translation initiation factor IF-1